MRRRILDSAAVDFRIPKNSSCCEFDQDSKLFSGSVSMESSRFDLCSEQAATQRAIGIADAKNIETRS